MSVIYAYQCLCCCLVKFSWFTNIFCPCCVNIVCRCPWCWTHCVASLHACTEHSCWDVLPFERFITTFRLTIPLFHFNMQILTPKLHCNPLIRSFIETKKYFFGPCLHVILYWNNNSFEHLWTTLHWFGKYLVVQVYGHASQSCRSGGAPSRSQFIVWVWLRMSNPDKMWSWHGEAWTGFTVSSSCFRTHTIMHLIKSFDKFSCFASLALSGIFSFFSFYQTVLWNASQAKHINYCRW